MTFVAIAGIKPYRESDDLSSVPLIGGTERTGQGSVSTCPPGQVEGRSGQVVDDDEEPDDEGCFHQLVHIDIVTSPASVG